MANNEQYPRFIPDKPTGDDVFEGQSQTNLANNICEYIRSNDSASSRGREQMPRIIGLEGKWGSGKSNVVEKIKKDLEGEGYYTFTYDAWGHQEDLQRRSILETLTNALIEDKVLEGKVKIKMRNGESKEAEWKDQLSLLQYVFQKFGNVNVSTFNLGQTFVARIRQREIHLTLVMVAWNPLNIAFFFYRTNHLRRI